MKYNKFMLYEYMINHKKTAETAKCQCSFFPHKADKEFYNEHIVSTPSFKLNHTRVSRQQQNILSFIFLPLTYTINHLHIWTTPRFPHPLYPWGGKQNKQKQNHVDIAWHLRSTATKVTITSNDS